MKTKDAWWRGAGPVSKESPSKSFDCSIGCVSVKGERQYQMRKKANNETQCTMEKILNRLDFIDEQLKNLSTRVTELALRSASGGIGALLERELEDILQKHKIRKGR